MTLRVVALWVAAVAVAVAASTAAVTLATNSVTQAPPVGLASPAADPSPDVDPTAASTPTPEPSPSDGATVDPSPADETDDTSAGPSPDDSTRDDDAPDSQSGTCSDRGGEARSTTSVGGQAGFCFIDGDVEFVYATPSNDGFTVDVDDEGSEVRVTFTSADHESRIDADYEDGQPRVRVREDAEDD